MSVVPENGRFLAQVRRGHLRRILLAARLFQKLVPRICFPEFLEHVVE